MQGIGCLQMEVNKGCLLLKTTWLTVWCGDWFNSYKHSCMYTNICVCVRARAHACATVITAITAKHQCAYVCVCVCVCVCATVITTITAKHQCACTYVCDMLIICLSLRPVWFECTFFSCFTHPLNLSKSGCFEWDESHNLMCSTISPIPEESSRDKRQYLKLIRDFTVCRK